MRSRSLSPLLVTIFVLSACGGASPLARNGGPAGQPPRITDENLNEVEQTFWRIDPRDPTRIAWRDALIAHRGRRTAEILAHGDYDAVVAHLAAMASFLTPEDLASRRVPRSIAPTAQWVLEHGSQRGDEGRVMAALMLLGSMGDRTAARRAEHQRIARWSRDARARIENPLERYGDLITVWEQHEELAPAPDVLDTLARLYVEQRSALVRSFGEGQGNNLDSRLSFQDLRLAPLLVQRAPLDVAAVYLSHGDLARAIDHVRRMGDESGMEEQLVRVLQRAQRPDPSGAQALDELARGYGRARPQVAAAICRLGVRRFPTDPRFPLCLARVAMDQEQPGTATGWYAEAVRLAPDQREVYDEALGRLAQVMESGLGEIEVAQSRAIAHHALTILDERTRRWPRAHAAVARDTLLLQIARAEIQRGNVTQARQRLEQSLRARATREAHEELGLLLERVGEARGAAHHYRRALDMANQGGAEGRANRAEIQEHLGDTFRVSGDERQAERMYRQALSIWNELVDDTNGARTSVVQVRRGVLLSRLGQRQAAIQAFNAAIDAAPSWREPYATILAHLVVSASPDVELAQTVMRRAQYQLTLEPQWKVYFALWVQTIAARASAQPEGDVRHVFSDLSRGDSWSSRLAAFGRGELAYAGLAQAARSRGERAEAHFYEGARLLGSGDTAGARRHFDEVIQSGMVGFYEYTMAQEFLASLPRPASGQAAAPPATPRR